MTVDRERAAAAIEDFLRALGHAPESDPELARTGQLVADAWSNDLLAGYALDARAILSEPLPTQSSELVAVRNIETVAMCPHHLMPATGLVHVTYAPSGRIVGLGALSRLVQCFSRRLVLQETLVQQVADALVEHLGARGAACVADLSPTCMTARGERESHARAVTLGAAGEMRAGHSLHAAAVAILGR